MSIGQSQPDLKSKVGCFAVIRALLPLVIAAGKVTVDYFGRDIDIKTKSDKSPFTAADLAAEDVILSGLADAFPGIPVVAEESETRSSSANGFQSEGMFFLVDPIDGTKEFINGLKDFTVNVALISDGQPVIGLVYGPALSTLWIGAVGFGAVRLTIDPNTPVEDWDSRLDEAAKISVCSPKAGEGLVAVASRSHRDAETDVFLKKLGCRDTVARGSSLKFCILAEGGAHVYPRFGPTMEWDTAAGDAVVRAAGGEVLDLNGKPFQYGKADAAFRNGGFVVRASPDCSGPWGRL